MSPADADLLAMPDPSSAVQLPWNPELAWVASDLVMDGKEVEQAPRFILKKMIKEAEEKGFKLKAGVEWWVFFSRAGRGEDEKSDLRVSNDHGV